MDSGCEKNNGYIKSSFGACLRDKHSELKTGHRKEAFASAVAEAIRQGMKVHEKGFYLIA